mmetsp:Transcript_14056/g.38552  ORF Transcript_14056/g.38552 Transcript_14056/m.38552 type:complete len:200 (-) Transcript_14056:1263-1862(-)
MRAKRKTPKRLAACSCWTCSSPTRTDCPARGLCGAGTRGTCCTAERTPARATTGRRVRVGIRRWLSSTKRCPGGLPPCEPGRTPRRSRRSPSYCVTTHRRHARCSSSPWAARNRSRRRGWTRTRSRIDSPIVSEAASRTRWTRRQSSKGSSIPSPGDCTRPLRCSSRTSTTCERRQRRRKCAAGRSSRGVLRRPRSPPQ